MQLVKEYILENKDLTQNEQIEKHAKWVEEIKEKHNDINKDNIDKIIEEEIGIVFMKVLENAGVFKRDEKGIAAFKKFISMLQGTILYRPGFAGGYKIRPYDF